MAQLFVGIFNFHVRRKIFVSNFFVFVYTFFRLCGAHILEKIFRPIFLSINATCHKNPRKKNRRR